jgi:hypothetical protein
MQQNGFVAVCLLFVCFFKIALLLGFIIAA